VKRRLGPLLRKELRQVTRSRGALLSSTLLPLLFLVVTPALQYWAIVVLQKDEPVSRAAVDPQPLGLSNDPQLVFTQVLLPMFVALSGLIVPSVAATYTVVGERERRSIDLLAALPVRAGDILWAKLLAVLSLAMVIVLPMYLFDAVVLIVLGALAPPDAVAMFVLLVTALTYAVGEALLLALLARDLRTAQNLNGALLVPAVLVTTAILFGAPYELRFALLSLVYLLGAGVAVAISLRWLTFERYLL
jgi:ABC-2 type transport system permease protein